MLDYQLQHRSPRNEEPRHAGRSGRRLSPVRAAAPAGSRLRRRAPRGSCLAARTRAGHRTGADHHTRGPGSFSELGAMVSSVDLGRAGRRGRHEHCVPRRSFRGVVATDFTAAGGSNGALGNAEIERIFDLPIRQGMQSSCCSTAAATASRSTGTVCSSRSAPRCCSVTSTCRAGCRPSPCCSNRDGDGHSHGGVLQPRYLCPGSRHARHGAGPDQGGDRRAGRR